VDTEPSPQIPLQPEETYFDLIEALHLFSVGVLFAFATTSDSLPDTIIRNFIARSTSCLNSIRQLWPMRHYADCWTLFRVMVDRVVHLHALVERGDWQLFEEWSFVWQFEANQRSLSDPLLGVKAAFAMPELSERQIGRYRELKPRNPKWQRPKAKDVLKSLGLPFLYSYAYDFASTQVHPMANDGEEEFYVLTRMKPDGFEVDRRVILNNAILLHTLLLQDGLNASGMRWRNLVFDFIAHARLGLGGDREYGLTFAKLAKAGADFKWSERL
jgi:hypothetical protein